MLTLFRRFMTYWRPVVQDIAGWIAKGLAAFGLFKLAVPDKKATTFTQAVLFLGSFFAWTWGVFRLGIINNKWWLKFAIWIGGGFIIALFTELLVWNLHWGNKEQEPEEKKWWEFWKEEEGEKDPAGRGGAQDTW